MVVEGPGWSLSGTTWDEALPHGLMKSWPLSLVKALDTPCPFSWGHERIPSPSHTGTVTASGTIHWG